VAEGLVRALAEAEVVGAGEELRGAVYPPRSQQLLRPQHAERLVQLRANAVLPAVAAGEGEIGHVGALLQRQRGQQLRILVVGVRADHQHALGGAEAAEREPQRRRAAILADPLLGRERTGGRRKQHERAQPRRGVRSDGHGLSLGDARRAHKRLLHG
jgi:hypothetical protein